MKIANYLIALSIVSCPLASPLQANVYSEFSKIKKEIEWGVKEDSTEHGRLLQQISLCFLERKLEKELHKLQWNCKRYHKGISYYEERVDAITKYNPEDPWAYNEWFYGEITEQEKLEIHEESLKKIENKRNKIADLDIQIAELQDYIARVREWKISLR